MPDCRQPQIDKKIPRIKFIDVRSCKLLSTREANLSKTPRGRGRPLCLCVSVANHRK